MGLLSMSCFNRQGEVKADDAKYTGTEPTWDDIDKLTEYQLTERVARGLAFYSYYCTKKDLLKDLVTYMNDEGFTKKQVNEIKRHYDKLNLFTAMKVARMFNRGCPKNIDNGTTYKYLNDELNIAINESKRFIWNKEKEKSEVPKVPQISPIQRLHDKCNNKVIIYCEIEIDSIIQGEEYVPINMTKLLGESEMSAKGCEMILECLHKEVMDFTLIQSGKDEDLNEAYSFVNKRQISKVIKTVRDWICDVEKYRQTVKKTTVRVKKVKPAGAQVKDLKYDKDGSSISATKIPGSIDTIIFNSKTRKLQIYKAVGRQGLSVKGTSIKDFDDVKSFQFTVRKVAIHHFIGKDPKWIEKNMSDKVKRTKVNGRVNEHCRIVYVK